MARWMAWLGATVGMGNAVWGWAATTLYVSPRGNDAWSGRLAEPNATRSDGPLASLEGAREAIRRMKRQGGLPEGGVVVMVRGGTYERMHPFELTAEDSGEEGKPILYRAYPGEEVRLVGGKEVKDWQPVEDPAVLARLDEAARRHVLQADLKALGLKDLGPAPFATGPGLELFFQDRPMTLARWPNEGFVRIAEVVGPTPVDVRGTKGCQEGVFLYEGDRPRRWLGEKEVWLHGYWFWDWADQRQPVASIDTEKHIITLKPPHHGYGYRKGQWYYAFNVLAELDSPGEWYLDREEGLLYFWPPAPLEQGRTLVSVAPALVSAKEVSHVTLQGFTLEAVQGTAITLEGGFHCRVVGCTLRNVGGWAVRIAGGKANGVLGCDIFFAGEGGIALSGGDRRSLAPAGHFAENNHIHHYSRWKRMYQPAIALSGVGNRAAHNLIHDAPHQAIAFSGNDHLIEFNEIHHVCLESNDAGALYAGRDWTMRGTVIRYNFFHHITGFENRGCMGVYLDDMFCGTTIFGNIFYQVTRAAFIGGGRDNLVENNIFVECEPAVHVDARAMGWASYHVDTTMKQRLEAVPYRQPPWSERYPQLVNILEDEPAAPKGNRIVRNLCVGGRWLSLEDRAKPYLHFQDNLLVEGDPGFVDLGRMDFRLREDSPAFRIGFQPIPFERIGLYPDEQRASKVERPLKPQ